MEVFQYIPFKSFVSPTFWHKLSEVKIDVDKLDDTPKTIYGFYTNYKAKNCLLEIDYSAFNSDFIPPKYNFTSYGTLYNKNTIEEFKECNKIALLEYEGCKFIDDIKSGKILDNPRLLARFFILSFADIKVHKYYYWFAFPATIHPTVKTLSNTKPKRLNEISILTNEKLFELFSNIKNEENKSFFIVEIDAEGGNLIFKSLKDKICIENKEKNFQNENIEKIFFCFTDPSEYEQPAWILRLFLAFLFETCPNLHGQKIQVIGIRQSKPNNLEETLIWEVIIPENNESENNQQKFVGWEINESGKMGPRIASMANSMDPAKLADNSFNLNLKLMKWRLLPELNLETIWNTKCLLFGAGTLGCAVTRNLLAWGFRTITFLDNGKVSFSNPVRQSLYKLEDAINGPNMKATTAAKRVLEINPNTTCKGYVVQIPMPGHTVGNSMLEEILKDLNIIEENVKKHDVLILLTDSRESRWLPTLLGAFHKKIVINAALGFDSYLVMRHGSHKKLETSDVPSSPTKSTENIGALHCIQGSNLGCYFCNDVTAPGDSMKNRTLDQQCTVTRPGVSNIAASYAVELLVSLLHHKDQDLAPAYYSTSDKNDISIPEGCLGIIPHSIRGMLCTFENILPATSKFSQCIACSEKVLEEYAKRGNEFFLDVFNSTKYLEDLTGISNLQAYENEIIECDDSDVEWSD